MTKLNIPVLLALLTFLGLCSCNKNSCKLLVGGYTKPGEKGLYVFDFNKKSGNLKLISQSDAGSNPSFFCYSGDRQLLYSLNEVREFKDSPGGGLTTLKFNSESRLFEKKNEMLVPYGGPCYISLSPDKRFLFLANYPNGSVAVVKLDATGIPESVTDTILYVKNSPDDSKAHMILSDPAGKHIYVADLGLDRILVYDFDRNTGKLKLLKDNTLYVPKGSGPRHFVFNADGTKMYLINELGSKMMVFNVDEKANLSLLQTLSTFRKGFEGINYCAEIQISNDGMFLYGSNRGENTIVTFRIGPDGMLTLAGHTSCGGNWPRNFVIDPSGKFMLVANQKSDKISVLKIDRSTGLPKESAMQYDAVAPAFMKFIN
jgi:6-phosphogluconolactonase